MYTKSVEGKDQGSTLGDPIYLDFFLQPRKNKRATVKQQFLFGGVKKNNYDACGNVGQALCIAMNYSLILEHLSVLLV